MENNVLLPVINGIADVLKGVNAKAQIYINTPPNVDSATGGYFYVKLVNVTGENLLSDTVLLHAVFDVMYFPAESQLNNSVVLMDALYSLNIALRHIYPANNVNGQYTKGRMKKGQVLDSKIVDDVVHTTVRYDLYLDVEEKIELVRDVFFINE